jgi:hypothetical protein
MTQYYKYPRTFHLPWSPGSSSDDKVLQDLSCFDGKTIVITEKMDGENCNLYNDKIHARSIDSKDHESRHWVKGMWGNIKNEIPNGWRICGENLFAKHSLFYDDLPSYFLVYSIWNEHNECLSWNDTLEVCNLLNLTPVRVIDVITYDENYLRNLSTKIDTDKVEGFVIRNSESFGYNEFQYNVAKWVRESHVTTNEHWMFEKIIENKLKQ